ncbi:hypothetical protein JCM11491_004454 [Sporobolomyces phaffii]
MTSITTFGYGLTVRGTDLITASLAWPSLEPTFHFFDLLSLRRRNGTLRVDEQEDSSRLGSLVLKVPMEVWEEVRSWVVALITGETENEMLVPYDATLEDILGGRYPEVVGWDRMTLACRGSGMDKIIRWDGLVAWVEQYIGYPNGAMNPIHRLVSAFGLAHPLPNMIPLHPLEPHSVDFIALLTIPFLTQDQAHSTLSANAEGRDQHTLVGVSLSLPPDADRRFVRLIRTFSLRVVEASNGTMGLASPTAAERQATTSKRLMGLSGIIREDVHLVDEIKPKWTLYSSCWPDSDW